MSHGNVNNSGVTWFGRLDGTGVVDLEEAVNSFLNSCSYFTCENAEAQRGLRLQAGG